MIQGATELGMLVWIQVTPMWVNDPVWGQDGRKEGEGRGMSRYLLREDIDFWAETSERD